MSRVIKKGTWVAVTRTSFSNRTIISLVATLLCYAPLASCAPGADEDGAQSQSGALVGQTLLEAGVLPVCKAWVESQFGASATDKLLTQAQCERGARFVHAQARQGKDTATGADVDVYFEAQEWAAANRPVPTSLVEEVQRPETAEALTNAAQNGFMDTPLSSRQAELWLEVAQGRLPLKQFFAETGLGESADVSNASGDISATQLGLANAETAGLGFESWARLLALGVTVIVGLALVACGGVRQITVDIGPQSMGPDGQPLPTPPPGTGTGTGAGNGTVDGSYSATPQFDPSNGRIVPIGGWGNTINQRWQRGAGGRANPDRGGETEWGLAAIEDLFETAPDGFTYNTVYQPFSDTSLPWLGFNTPNAFVDIPGSPKLGPYNPEQREVAFTVESVQVTATVFWFVVSSENGRASMLTDILGDEQGANNPLRYRSGTFPLAVFTSLPSGGATASYGIVVGPTDGRVGFRFVDVSTEDGMPGPSAPTTVNGIAAQRLGAGVASDGVSKLTAQPYAIVTSPEGSAPAGEFAIGFGYVDGQTRATPTYDFHVTFQAQ